VESGTEEFIKFTKDIINAPRFHKLVLMNVEIPHDLHMHNLKTISKVEGMQR
jgi:hypothetical protein